MMIPSPPDPEHGPPRRPLQFSLSAAMIVIAVLAAFCGTLRYLGVPPVVLAIILAIAAVGALAALLLVVVISQMDNSE